MRLLTALAPLTVVLSAASCASVPRGGRACSADLAAEERAVRAISASYATVRDVETEIAEFTDDVWFFSTLTPQPTVGRAARRATIEKRRAPAPGEHTRRETSGVILSACGDLAVEHGRYATTWDGPTGPDSVAGYYLQAYRKVGGQWKIAAASVHRRP
jgi:ketosteroid isomerase-like protein